MEACPFSSLRQPVPSAGPQEPVCTLLSSSVHMCVKDLCEAWSLQTSRVGYAYLQISIWFVYKYLFFLKNYTIWRINKITECLGMCSKNSLLWLHYLTNSKYMLGLFHFCDMKHLNILSFPSSCFSHSSKVLLTCWCFLNVSISHFVSRTDIGIFYFS